MTTRSRRRDHLGLVGRPVAPKLRLIVAGTTAAGIGLAALAPAVFLPGFVFVAAVTQGLVSLASP